MQRWPFGELAYLPLFIPAEETRFPALWICTLLLCAEALLSVAATRKHISSAINVTSLRVFRNDSRRPVRPPHVIDFCLENEISTMTENETWFENRDLLSTTLIRLHCDKWHTRIYYRRKSSVTDHEGWQRSRRYYYSNYRFLHFSPDDLNKELN